MSAAVTTRTIEVDGLSVVVDEAGTGGRPLLLVHGFGGCRDDFAPVIGPLADLGRHVATADNRGHGDSGRPDGPEHYTVERMAADVLGLADTLGWTDFVLLGHSLGGMIAQRVVEVAPARVTALVLLGTTYTTLGIDRDSALSGAHIVRIRGLPALVEIMDRMEDPVAAAPSFERACERIPGYRERGGRNTLRCSAEMYATLLSWFVDAPDRSVHLQAIGCPTLVLVGAEDKLMLRGSRRMAELIPGAKLVVIPDAAHSPQFENPEGFLAALLPFLSSVAEQAD